jgi:hypothetical protein
MGIFFLLFVGTAFSAETDQPSTIPEPLSLANTATGRSDSISLTFEKGRPRIKTKKVL